MTALEQLIEARKELTAQLASVEQAIRILTPAGYCWVYVHANDPRYAQIPGFDAAEEQCTQRARHYSGTTATACLTCSPACQAVYDRYISARAKGPNHPYLRAKP